MCVVHSEGYAFGWPGDVWGMVPDLLPGHAFLGCADFEACVLERVGVGGEVVNPFGEEVGVIGLAFESTDFVGDAVDLDEGLGFYTSEDGIAGGQVVEGYCCRVGCNAEGSAYEVVGD